MSHTELLKSFFAYQGEYFMIVQSNGIIVVECDKEDDERLAHPEAILRLFMTARDAAMYKDRSDNADTRVGKVSLIGLWSLLERIDKLSMKQFKRPVRVEVAAMNGTSLVTVDVLHSIYELCS